MTKRIVIHVDQCTGCLMCAQACSLAKTGTINPAAARIRVVDWEDSGVTVPIVCQHCAEPVCLPACPAGAIGRDPASGTVRIDPELCTNCSTCRKVCPYAGPVWSPPEKQVVLCDLCDGAPQCVSACPTAALEYRDCAAGDAGRLAAMGAIRQTLVKKERRQ